MEAKRPENLGRYEILEELGKGSMGVVYLAHDPLIGRSVALKTFRIGFLADDDEMEQFRARFIREAQSAGILNHPGIVTIHDVVEKSGEGVTFIAMEYVEGTDLKRILRDRGRLDLRTTVDIIDQLADALDYAHSKGVVHRDIKPANIILTDGGEIKITDFGIARVNSSNLTHDGQMLGTPNYMSPEQIQGKEVDHRADLFSLAVVLYESLTGYKPFQGDNLTVVSHRIVYDAYTPYEDLVRNLPPGVNEVLSRALAKDPEERYQAGSELAADLRLLILDSGVVEVPEAESPPPPAADPPTLNDTQDLSSSLPPGPETLTGTLISPPGLTERDGNATRVTAADKEESASAESPPQPAASPLPEDSPLPAPTVTPTAAPTSTGGLPWGKLLHRHWPIGVVAAVLLAVLVGLGLFLLGAGDRQAKADRNRERQIWNGEVQRVLEQSWTQLEAAEYGSAVQALDRLLARIGARREVLGQHLEELRKAQEESALAERRQDLDRLAMQDAEAVELRRQAEWHQEEEAVARYAAAVVTERLDAARRALVAGNPGNARTVVLGALEIDPGNEEGWRLAQEAEVALAEARDRRRRQRAAAPPPPPPVPETIPPPPPPPTTPVPTTATLEVRLESEVPRGVLIVYFGESQLLREDFRFGGGGGLFRRSQKTGGTWNHSETVPAGTRTLRVFVTTGSGQPAEVQELTANFPGGGRRTLRIHVNGNGTVTASLL